MNLTSAQKGEATPTIRKDGGKSGGKEKAGSALEVSRAAEKKDFREVLRQKLKESEGRAGGVATLLKVLPQRNPKAGAKILVQADAVPPEGAKKLVPAHVGPHEGVNKIGLAESGSRDVSLQGTQLENKPPKESAALFAGFLVPRLGVDPKTKRDTSLRAEGHEIKQAERELPRAGRSERLGGTGEMEAKVSLIDRRLVARENQTATQRTDGSAGGGLQAVQLPRLDMETNGEHRQIAVRLEGPATQALRSEIPVARSASVPAAFYHQLQGEFVDHAKIIMKDGGGELRMMLKPQNLGSLRLSVTLEERVLKGHIVVDNESVRALVESQLDSLLRSFKEGGFDPLLLTVSVAGEQGGGQRWNDSGNGGKKQSEELADLTLTEKGENDTHIRLEA